MSEEQAEYNIDEVREAMEMLSKGYHDQPSVVIEPPRIKIVRESGELVEYKEPPWIKMSTGFKDELKDISANALKIWLYIVLCIDEDSLAFPSIRTIAKETNLSHQTVVNHMPELEEKGLLKVRRGEKRFNIYKATSYVALGKGNDPIVPKNGTFQTVEQLQENVPDSPPDRSSGFDSNKRNKKKKQEGLKTSENKPIGLEWKILSGAEITEEDVIDRNAPLNEFERIFGFGTLPWESNSKWDNFARFVRKTTENDPDWMRDYVTWREGDGKYKAFSNRKIRENPQMFMDTGYPEYNASKIYRQEPVRPEHKKYVPEEGNYVPNPNRR